MRIDKIIVSKPFRYLWLKQVRGVNLNQHCSQCLRGSYNKIINNEVKSLNNISLSEGVYYLCGVATPYNWSNNFHLAFEPLKGNTIDYEDNGIHIVITDAISLPISDKYIDESNPHSDERLYKTCRNWWFAHYYHKKYEK